MGHSCHQMGSVQKTQVGQRPRGPEAKRRARAGIHAKGEKPGQFRLAARRRRRWDLSSPMKGRIFRRRSKPRPTAELLRDYETTFGPFCPNLNDGENGTLFSRWTE